MAVIAFMVSVTLIILVPFCKLKSEWHHQIIILYITDVLLPFSYYIASNKRSVIAMKRNEVYGISDCIKTTPNTVYGISTDNTGIQGNKLKQPVLGQTNDGQSGPSPTHAYEDVYNFIT